MATPCSRHRHSRRRHIGELHGLTDGQKRQVLETLWTSQIHCCNSTGHLVHTHIYTVSQKHTLEHLRFTVVTPRVTLYTHTHTLWVKDILSNDRMLKQVTVCLCLRCIHTCLLVPNLEIIVFSYLVQLPQGISYWSLTQISSRNCSRQYYSIALDVRTIIVYLLYVASGRFVEQHLTNTISTNWMTELTTISCGCWHHMTTLWCYLWSCTHSPSDLAIARNGMLSVLVSERRRDVKLSRGLFHTTRQTPAFTITSPPQLSILDRSTALSGLWSCQQTMTIHCKYRTCTVPLSCIWTHYDRVTNMSNVQYNTCLCLSWWHITVVRTSVYDQRTFPGLRHDEQLTADLFRVNRMLYVSQHGQLSHSSSRVW